MHKIALDNFFKSRLSDESTDFMHGDRGKDHRTSSRTHSEVIRLIRVWTQFENRKAASRVLEMNGLKLVPYTWAARHWHRLFILPAELRQGLIRSGVLGLGNILDTFSADRNEGLLYPDSKIENRTRPRIRIRGPLGVSYVLGVVMYGSDKISCDTSIHFI